MARPVGTTQDFCKRGHKLYAYNLYIVKGRRRCKACFKLKEREYFYKKMLKKVEKRLALKKGLS